MALIAAQQEGHQDGRCAARYEKIVAGPHKRRPLLTLEHAKLYSDSYGYIENQEDVDAYNAAFSITYKANRTQRLSRSAKHHIG
jgi:hypothetical protein